ncbi:MAG TPA: RNA polymerase sigma factor [Streptosporangiaceae bacterium]
MTVDIHFSDAELIGQSQTDPELFTAIFDRHCGEILRYVHARLGPDLAEDVTSETFLAAFGARGRFDPEAVSARPWLYGIAVRQIGKHRRAEGRRIRLLRLAPRDLPTEDFGDRAAERVTAGQLGPRLAAVLARLPGKDRELLLLIAWAELSYDEAATALGTTVSAVKARLHRVRVRIRRELGGANPMQANTEGDSSDG